MEIYHKIQDAIDQSEPVALCTIVESRGSTPRHGGSKMLVYPGDDPGKFRIFGTVGGGEVEGRVIQEALQVLKDGKNRLLRYEMVDPRAGDPGVCGGQLEVYVEPILPKPCLVVIGGGHVGKAVAHLAHWLGFRVAVCDDRAEYCTAQENPDADEFYPVAMGDLPSHLRITSSTYLVCTSRGAGVDIPGLPPLLDTQAAYIGVIGSRRRWAITRQGLQEAGVSAEKINRIHSPVGLELNAETPEEIAVSILAEIIQVRNGGTGHSMKI